MATLREDTRGKIRDLPIEESLRDILTEAATRAGIDLVRVTSGGQAAKGTPGKRTGSTRHDLGRAADLEIWLGGRPLSFVKSTDLPFFKRFIGEAVGLGATGVGAGVGYMGPTTVHMGFGAPAVWGAGGKNANAPQWLREAVEHGRTGNIAAFAPHPPSPIPGVLDSQEYVVTARSGLNIRSGPGTLFPVITAVQPGTHLWGEVLAQGAEWIKADLGNDGLFDGFVFAAYLSQAA